jgi:hypothetical protein
MTAGVKKVFVTRLTDVDTSDKDGVGTIRFEGANVYKYVQVKNHTATVAGAVGSLVGYFAGTGWANSRVVVDLSDADTIPVGAGALLAVITGTLDVAYYAWMQIKGQITLDTSVTSGAAGKSFYLTGTDKTAAIGATDYDQLIGVSLDGTTKVLLNAPF